MARRHVSAASSQGRSGRETYLLTFEKNDLLRFARNVLNRQISSNMCVEEIVARIIRIERQQEDNGRPYKRWDQFET